MTAIADRLADLGITLPSSPAPVANYVPYTISGNQIIISGQLSIENGNLISGLLGDTLNVEEGAYAARLCGLNLIAQLNQACREAGKSLDDVRRVLRLGGFVASTRDFTDHPKIINGASDLMVEIFGYRGRHARAAVGVAALPLGAAVEVDGLFEIG